MFLLEGSCFPRQQDSMLKKIPIVPYSEQEFPQSSETGICSRNQHLITAVKQGFISVKLVCGK